jgi:hypothetical protein
MTKPTTHCLKNTWKKSPALMMDQAGTSKIVGVLAFYSSDQLVYPGIHIHRFSDRYEYVLGKNNMSKFLYCSFLTKSLPKVLHILIQYTIISKETSGDIQQ